MKKAYVKPSMESEVFLPNTYIAACEILSTWRVKCNVPSGIGYYETNGIPGYQEGNWREEGDEYIASGSGCGTWHEGVNTEPVANAMWQEFRSGKYYPVFFWEQRIGGLFTSPEHFSKVEDAEWEHEKNHS